MTRRSLFGLLAGAIAGATLDPERALWIPGNRLISIPTRTAPSLIAYAYTGNVILTPSVIARQMLKTLEGNLHAARAMNRDLDQQFPGTRRAVGQVVAVRRPYRFVTA